MKRWRIAAIFGLCFFGGSNDLANAQSKLNFDEKIAALDAWTVGYNRREWQLFDNCHLRR